MGDEIVFIFSALLIIYFNIKNKLKNTGFLNSKYMKNQISCK